MAIAIRYFLKNPSNYTLGVKIYAENGGNPALLQLLNSGKNSYTKKKLIEGLQALLNKEVSLPKPPINTIKVNSHSTEERDTVSQVLTASPVFHSKENLNIYPEQLQEMHRELHLKLGELNYLKANLPLVSERTRLSYCLRIMENKHRVKDIYTILDYWDANKVVLNLDNQKKASSENLYDIGKAILNARSNISKHRKTGNEILLQKWETKLRELEEKKEELYAV